MRFDWADLRIFLHVCEAGSMTGAAARCHLTLAAVSARMRKLEEATGVLLVKRLARGVTPTAAGEVLAAHARRIFDQVQHLERELLDGRAGGTPPVLMLANSSALAQWSPESLIVRDKDLSRLPIVVRESPSEATVQALRCGAADVGIVSDAVDTRGLVVQELGPDPLVLVVPVQHPLAELPSVPFDRVIAEPWVVWGEQSALSTHLQMRAFARGARIEGRVTHPTLEGVLGLVACGAGVTVLPDAALRRQAGARRVARVPLAEAWARRRLFVCRPDGLHALRSELVERVARGWPAE
jgi:DNA-binding transcriptional LysR family regulator